MVESAQDVAGDDAAAALNRSAMWGIFLQAEMGPCRVVIRSVFLQDALKMGLAPHDYVVKTLARIEPIARSIYPFCHGDRGAMGRSRMPIDRTRCVNTAL